MSDSWFDQMDKAMQARKVAIAGRDRWQEKVDAAEAAIAELTALRDAPAPFPSLTEAVKAAQGDQAINPLNSLTAPSNVFITQQ